MDPVPSDNAIYEEIKVQPTMPSGRFDVDGNICYGKVSVAAPKIANGGGKCKKGLLLIVLILFALLFAIAGACVAFSLEITKLKSDITSFNGQMAQLRSKIDRQLQQLSESNIMVALQLNSSNDVLYQQLSLQNSSIDSAYQQLSMNEKVSQQLNTSIDMLHQQLSQQNDSFDHAYQQLRQEYTALDNRTQLLNTSTQLLFNRLEGPAGQYPFYPAASCAALPPSSPSGYYWVRASNGSAVSVYCDMTLSCGGVTGGWMRVVELDMTDSSQQCPSGLLERTYSDIRTCGKTSDSAGCSSVSFPVPSNYSEVCGKIIGYQVGSPDTFGDTGRGTSPSIDTFYVDGVSLTHGNPRQHIWTFAAGLDEVSTRPRLNCPCTNTATASQATPPPAFVGNDYFCDTGISDSFQNHIFYSDDPLWDGAGCGPQNTCCSFNNPLWFYKQLPQPTTDEVEMRLCRDQTSDDEDVPIEMVNIYVQ